MWTQLKRVAIPVFSGNKKTYESWKAAFIACIDKAPATPEYKLLQLRQYLSGEALKTMENLGHSGYAYEAAKERLDRKFGGQRRQIAIKLEELENFKPLRPEKKLCGNFLTPRFMPKSKKISPPQIKNLSKTPFIIL